MPTAKKTSLNKSTPPSAAKPPDAIKLLTEDHQEVKALFKAYEKLVKSEAQDDEKVELADQICAQLTAHATVEEELFYPAARDALSEDDTLVDEADVEHACAKELIAQIQDSSPADDDHFDAKVKVLSELIAHHVKEEEDEMFPKLRKSELDLAELGAEIAARKQALLAEMAAQE
jgi:hemerythrin superfamily protein